MEVRVCFGMGEYSTTNTDEIVSRVKVSNLNAV
jgi:hypothetical protein